MGQPLDYLVCYDLWLPMENSRGGRGLWIEDT